MTTNGRIPARQLDATGTRDATTFLRGDGVWVAPAGPTYATTAELADVNAAAESAGVSNTTARGDHKHSVATAAPVALTGATQAVGTSTSLARADHQHGNPGITVQDENGNVGTGVTQIDFQGAGVSATAGTGEVVVTIAGGSASGGVGELLMQDGVTAPPVPIENEARSDWLYEG